MKSRSIQVLNTRRKKNHRLMVLLLMANILLCLNFSSVSANLSADSLISQGNNYYMQHQYEMASAYYTQVILLGMESAYLYYNLGNAYYKQDKLANAILYYEKALLLKPGDEDIRQNLTLANAHIIDKIDVIPEFFLKRWIRFIQGLFSPDQWAILSIALFVLALTGFSLFFAGERIVFKKAGFSSGMVLLLITILGVIMMISRMQSIQHHNHAIIMVPSVNARSSPDEQSTNVFVLHEGTKVMVMDSVEHWKEIRIANGNKGWVPGEMMEGI